MAQYIFVKFRDPAASGSVLSRLESICGMLTPQAIRDRCVSTVSDWPGSPGGYYAIQNSHKVAGQTAGVLAIGWVAPCGDGEGSMPSGVESDGSYAIIKANLDAVSFFTDQFGSRTLWYYLDDEVLVVSTSQRAIVRFKGAFVPNQAATAWFLSSGCQGPFISWDAEISQVRPEFEYRFNISAWSLSEVPKGGMKVPASGTGSVPDYLDLYESTVTAHIEEIISAYEDQEVLLPLSGGLDSRLILALARNAGIDQKLQLGNWGVPSSDGVFDDMGAAVRVAAHYGKTVIRGELPRVVHDLDVVLDRYVEASEGRVDHFNGYTDGFAMWDRFTKAECRCIMRGDIPFTEGLDINNSMARAHLGLERLDDFSNIVASPLSELATLQTPFGIARERGESMVRWRDRLYAQWRVPMVISAFTDIVSGYVENSSPMMSWKLYCGYMALPDSAKGNKKHIEMLWRKYDHSGVPSNAIGALQTPAGALTGFHGEKYVARELTRIADSGAPYSDLAAWVRNKVAFDISADVTAKSRHWQLIRGKAADVLPLSVKGWLKSHRPRTLLPNVIAYRLILTDKIHFIYTQAARATDTDGVSP